jgi:N-acetyl-gamma-glutamyl-phosphate reductase
MAYKVGVIGAAGFAGAELVRLVLGHPEFELSVITSNADAGTPLAEAYPAFAGASDISFTTHDDPAVRGCDLVFLAVPHTAAMAQVPALLAAGVTVVDLSADYRLADKDVYEQWYGAEHTSPELLATRAFGLPELFAEDLAAAHELHASGKPALVACAGCYPTATSIASAPAVRAGWTEGLVIVDAKSGVTGAGKGCNAKTHFCGADEDVQAYNVGKHRHTPEIEQILGKPGQVVFTPHLVPQRRGILSTVYLQLTAEAAAMSVEDMVAYYNKFYEGRPCVQVLPAGKLPHSSSVTGTNLCHVGLAKNERTNTLVAIGAIDNLCKGAAGQAVQCANIVLGLPETTGLATVGMPV